MSHHLPSIIRSISIPYKQNYWFTMVLLVSIGTISTLVQATQEEWILSGTFLSDSNGHAMFVDTDGNEQLVSLGEKIQDCQLEHVSHGSAKLRCEKQLYVLHLRNSVGDISQQALHPSSNTQQQSFTLSKNEVMDYVKQRQRLVSEIGFLPLVEDQQVIGFTVSKIRPNTTVATLGLFNGDVIKSINGVPATQSSQFLQIVNELSLTAEVSIEVDRYGKTLAYTYILE